MANCTTALLPLADPEQSQPHHVSPEGDTLGWDVVRTIRKHLARTGLKWSQLRGADVAALIDAEIVVKPAERRAKAQSFVPPTPAEVTAYSAEIGYPMDGQAWCDAYALKNWRTSGSTRMIDWRAAVRRWKAMGWQPTGGSAVQPTSERASLGALQMQLKTVEDELNSILRPGGCAFKVTPVGAKLIRYDELMRQRDILLSKIRQFGTS